MMEVSTNLTVVIIIQCTHVSNNYSVYFEHILSLSAKPQNKKWSTQLHYNYSNKKNI
jgi:hypothetical protein